MMNFLIGLVAGTFGGLVGLGGGVIMVPLMVGILKLGQHKAHGTSLVALIFTGLTGSVTYALKGSIDILASARFANSLPDWKLKKSFGGFMILITLLLLLKPYLVSMEGSVTVWTKIVVLLLTGAFTGFLSGMMGVGGGTIMVPAMVLLAGITQHTAQGSSLLAMVPAGGVGAFTHWRLGNVNKSILPWLIAGILIGTYLGGSFASILSDDVLRYIFAAVLIWTGVKYLRTPVPRVDEG